MDDGAPSPEPPRRSTSLKASFGHALSGLAYVIAHERNARIHLAAAVAVLSLAAWLRLAPQEWAVIIIAVALVFAGEMLNTVVEVVVDMITLRDHPLAKRAKDVAAGAVLVAAIAAAAMGLVVLGPHLLQRLGWPR